MTNWIVAHCHANAEAKAELNLKRQGFNVYLPRYKRTRSHARRVETVIRPLFPRYLFIGFDAEQTSWRPIRSTFGISHIISAGERPLFVPTDVITQLRQCEDKSGLFVGYDKTLFNKGDALQIISGPFYDCLGTFVQLNDNRRVAVLLEIMGRQVKTLVPLEAVRRAS